VQLQVGAVEAGVDDVPGVDIEGPCDVGGGLAVCRGCQGQHARDVQLLGRAGDLQVFRAKVVAPLAYAVGLVHGQQRHVRAPDGLEETFVGQPFRRNVQELQLPVPEPAQHVARLLRVQAGIVALGGDAARLQEVDLVLHQGDERRDHQRHAGQGQRGQLVAQALAAAGREDGQDASAFQQAGDGLGLAGAQGVEAEGIVEQAGYDRRDLHGGSFMTGYEQVLPGLRPGPCQGSAVDPPGEKPPLDPAFRFALCAGGLWLGGCRGLSRSRPGRRARTDLKTIRRPPTRTRPLQPSASA